MILVVHGVLDGNILEQTTFCNNDVLYLGLHFPHVKEHATRLTSLVQVRQCGRIIINFSPVLFSSSPSF